ncbi:uncharacterized protein B0H18DRAFT_960939 [Fomitopsis serialis]|uniref:uncharacterized protein n=1 Tax=Fomitopsis serialis TaxID=139415 RepID=UPI002008BE2C|nr:uncharacterized protein B0H18DRAFT_960939 [Neoantrodia serialis]KAH9912602.1 hypothetical protein B0H18DRAFT_960939 [Neoantrodia serialis]
MAVGRQSPMPIEISSDDDTESEVDDGVEDGPVNVLAGRAIQTPPPHGSSLEGPESPPYRSATPIDVSSTDETDSDLETGTPIRPSMAVPKTTPNAIIADDTAPTTPLRPVLGSPVSLERSLVEERRGLPATEDRQNWRGLPDIAKPIARKKGRKSDRGRPTAGVRPRASEVGRPKSGVRSRASEVGRPKSGGRCRMSDSGRTCLTGNRPVFEVPKKSTNPNSFLGGVPGPSRPKSNAQLHGKDLLFGFNDESTNPNPFSRGVPGPSRPKSDAEPYGAGLRFRMNDEFKGRSPFVRGVPGPWRSTVASTEESQFEGEFVKGPRYDAPVPRMVEHDIQQGAVLRARLEALRELQRANRRGGEILAKMAKYYGTADKE